MNKLLAERWAANIMEIDVFQGQVRALQDKILEAVEVFFASQDSPFIAQDFMDQTSIDLEQLAREAHFFGAGIFPDVEKLSIAA